MTSQNKKVVPELPGADEDMDSERLGMLQPNVPEETKPQDNDGHIRQNLNEDERGLDMEDSSFPFLEKCGKTLKMNSEELMDQMAEQSKKQKRKFNIPFTRREYHQFIPMPNKLGYYISFELITTNSEQENDTQN